MNTRYGSQARQDGDQTGITLIGTLKMISASAVVLLAVLSIMHVVKRQNSDVQQLTNEFDYTLENIAREIEDSYMDSVTVSAWGDTVKLNGGRRIFKDDEKNLVLTRDSVPFLFLEKMVHRFYADAPVVTDVGDTLWTVAIRMVVEKGDIKDSTYVLMTPGTNNKIDKLTN